MTARALLFDLDGTLADTAPDLFTALNRVLQHLNYSMVTLEDVRGWIGNGIESLLRCALVKTSEREADVRLINKAIGLFNSFYSEAVWAKSVCYPGVLDGLADLKRMGFKLACVTNKPRVFSHEVLRQSGLARFFDLMVAGNDLSERKPSPAPLLHAVGKLEVSASECIVVGDSKNDVVAARNAGMMVLLVTWGYHQGLGLSEMGATQLIKKFSHISKAVVCRGIT